MRAASVPQAVNRGAESKEGGENAYPLEKLVVQSGCSGWAD
jgi:hypothetical protein